MPVKLRETFALWASEKPETREAALTFVRYICISRDPTVHASPPDRQCSPLGSPGCDARTASGRHHLPTRWSCSRPVSHNVRSMLKFISNQLTTLSSCVRRAWLSVCVSDGLRWEPRSDDGLRQTESITHACALLGVASKLVRQISLTPLLLLRHCMPPLGRGLLTNVSRVRCSWATVSFLAVCETGNGIDEDACRAYGTTVTKEPAV